MLFPKTDEMIQAIKTHLGVDAEIAGFSRVNNKIVVNFKIGKHTMKLFATGAHALVEGRKVGVVAS